MPSITVGGGTFTLATNYIESSWNTTFEGAGNLFISPLSSAAALNTGILTVDNGGFTSVSLGGLTIGSPGANNVTAALGSMTLGSGGLSVYAHSIAVNSVVNSSAPILLSAGAAGVSFASGSALSTSGAGNSIVVAAQGGSVTLAATTVLNAANANWYVYENLYTGVTSISPQSGQIGVFGTGYAANPPSSLVAEGLTGNRYVFQTNETVTVSMPSSVTNFTYGTSSFSTNGYSFVGDTVGSSTGC
jgi:hypothetical protein